jgi:hypothetical protein
MKNQNGAILIYFVLASWLFLCLLIIANVCSLDSYRVSLTICPSFSKARRNLLCEMSVPLTDGASLAESIIFVKLALEGSNLNRDLAVFVRLLPFVEFKSACRAAFFVFAAVVIFVLTLFTASLSESEPIPGLLVAYLDTSGVDTFDELAFFVFE